MHTHRPRGTNKIIAVLTAVISLLGVAFAFPHFAFADYTVFQNYESKNSTSASGISTTNKVAMVVTATSTGRINELTYRACGTSGSIRWVAYTGDVTGTTSLPTLHPVATSSWTALPTDCTNYGTTTSTFTTGISVVSGVTVTFISEADTDGGVQTTGFNYLTFPSYYWDGAQWAQAPSLGSNFIGIGTGAVPINQGYGTTTGQVTCDTFDVGCYMSTAFAWAFFPSVPLSEQLGDLASSTRAVKPFGYVFGITDKLDYYSHQATSSLSITVELSPVLNFMGANFPTTTMTLISGSGLRATLGTTMWTFIQNLLIACMWAGFAFYVYRRSIHLL